MRTLAIIIVAFALGVVADRLTSVAKVAPAAETLSIASSKKDLPPINARKAAEAPPAAAVVTPPKPAMAERPRYSEEEKERRLMQTAVNKAGLVVDLDRQFGDLFRQLKLKPEDAARLRQLLASRENIQFLVQTALENDGMEQDVAMGAELTQAEEAKLDVKLKAVLGEDGYKKFIDYKNSMYQQGVATNIESRLRNLHLDLTDEQRQAIVRAHLQAEPTPFQSPLWNSDVATFDRYFQQQRAVLDSVMAGAGSKLSAEQRAEIQRFFDEKLEPMRRLRELNAAKQNKPTA